MVFPRLPCLILGLASPEIVCLVQDALLQHYPSEHVLTIIHAAGWSAPEEWQRVVTLGDLLVLSQCADELTSAYVPAHGAAFDFRHTELASPV